MQIVSAMDDEPSAGLSQDPESKEQLRDPSSSRDRRIHRGKPVSKKWKPVWLWLESLQRPKVVDSAEVTAWLNNNPAYAAEMKRIHSHGSLVHYVQKCHSRLVNGRPNKVDGNKVSFQRCQVCFIVKPMFDKLVRMYPKICLYLWKFIQ